MTRKPRNGTVLLDGAKIDFALREAGLSWTSEKTNCDVSRSTWQRVRNGQRVSRRIADDIAQFLSNTVADLIVSEPTNSEAVFRWPEHPEWKIVSAESGWQTTSNGLNYFRCKVEHKHIGIPSATQFGRARVYDLSRVPDRDRVGMRQHLTRHALVCREFSGHPHFVRNLCVAPVAQGQFWWVVDEWLEAQLLSDLISRGSLRIEQLNQIMMKVASGLCLLHDRDYLIRELSPNRLLVEETGDVRFTDLDLAKLLFTDKTVSNGWATDIYRAPEVSEDRVSVRSDFYSWAMIYLHAAAGDCTLNRTSIDSVNSLARHANIKCLLHKCLSPTPSKRPMSASQLLNALASSQRQI